MANFQHRKKPSSGFTLIEIVVSMALSLILIAIFATVLVANLRSYEFSKSLSYMQANAEFIMSKMQRDLRMAGYQGCSDHFLNPMTVIASSAPTNNFQATRVIAAQIGTSGWTPSEPPGYVAPTGIGAPVVGTDALLIQFASSEQGALASDMTGTTSITINDNGELDLQQGELAVISNCSTANLFTVASAGGTNGVVTISSAESLPQSFSVQEQNSTSLLSSNSTGASGSASTSVHRFHSRIYYVGNTGRINKTGDSINALYLQTWPYQAANPPIELVEGVEQLQVGVSMHEASPVTYLSPGDAGFDPQQSSSVQFGILMSSIERLSKTDQDKTYRLGGITVTASDSATIDPDAPSYAKGKRVHRAFSTIVKLRNTANAI